MRKERRKEKRIEIYTRARVVAGTTESFGYVHNLSTEGLGLFCRQMFQVRDPLEIKLELQEKVLILKGMVIWRLDNPAHEKGPYQYGIQLEEKPDEYEVELKVYKSEIA